MGLAAPFVLVSKQLVQELTKQGLGWDEPISKEDQVIWQQWKDKLPFLTVMKVSRCVKPHDFGEVVKADLLNFYGEAEDLIRLWLKNASKVMMR